MVRQLLTIEPHPPALDFLNRVLKLQWYDQLALGNYMRQDSTGTPYVTQAGFTLLIPQLLYITGIFHHT